MTSLEPRKSKIWSHEDVLVLLSFLNYYVTEIREMVDKDHDNGIAAAVEFLATKVGGGCTSARVKGKLAHLWTSYGSDNSTSPDDVYRHGAYIRTLPRLDRLYPGMLEEIASRVKLMQSDESNDQEVKNLRRSKRQTNASRDKDPMRCRCGYTHDDFCLPCANCRSWQHGYCFYNSDAIKELPNDHLCDECRADSDTLGSAVESEGEELPAAFNRLRVKDRATEEQHMRRRQYCALSIFGDAENVLWGPTDGEIVEQFQTLAFQIRTLANSISHSNIDFKMASWKFYAEHKELSDLFETCFGVGYKEQLQLDITSICFVDVLRALIGAAVTNWTFYPIPHETKSKESLLCETYQELILSRDGYKTLKGLHRTAWNHLIDDCPERLRGALSKEAEVLAGRLLTILAPFLIHREHPKAPLTTEDWKKSNEHGKQHFHLIVQLFNICLKLKADLPMTDKCYEIFSPAAGLDFDARLMTTEMGDPKPAENLKGLKIELTFMPVVVEHPANAKGGGNGELVDLFGSHNFVKTSGIDWKKCRVVFRSIVKLY